MPLHLKIHHEPDGSWLFAGLPGQPLRRFDDLHRGLEAAKHDSCAAPALIELHIDGLLVEVHQESGWPNQICCSARHLPAPPAAACAMEVRWSERANAATRRLLARLQGKKRAAWNASSLTAMPRRRLLGAECEPPATRQRSMMQTNDLARAMATLDRTSRHRVQIFACKLLVMVPVCIAFTARDYPLLVMISFFCIWNAIFAGLAATIQRQRLGAAFLTAWDEGAAFLAIGLLARLCNAATA